MWSSVSSGDAAMSRSSWSARDERMTHLLALGHTQAEVARQVRVSSKTVQRKYGDPAFADHVSDLGAEFSRANCARLLALECRAVDVIADALASENARVRLEASRIVLTSSMRARALLVDSRLEERIERTEREVAALRQETPFSSWETDDAVQGR